MNTYEKIYQEWLNSEVVSMEAKAELVSLTEEEKEDCFYQELKFGTGALRGVLRFGTDCVNIYTVRKRWL